MAVCSSLICAVLALLAAVCSGEPVPAQSPPQKKNFVNIEHGWPIEDTFPFPETDEDGLVMQLPACRAVRGVCALTSDCQKQFIHETRDLCGDESTVSCCLTYTDSANHVVQTSVCAKSGGVCTWDFKCPDGDRHPNRLMCGDQNDISCCRTLNVVKKRGDYPTIANFRTNNFGKRTIAEGDPTALVVAEQHEGCLSTGSYCQKNSECSHTERYNMPHLCGNQTDVSCCRRMPEKRSDSCSLSGGECVAPTVCQNGSTDPQANCPGNLVCCIWTRRVNSGN